MEPEIIPSVVYYEAPVAKKSNRGRKAKNHHTMVKIQTPIPGAVLMRQVFRKFADAMRSKSLSAEWRDKLLWCLSNDERKRLDVFIENKECVYAYKQLANGSY